MKSLLGFPTSFSSRSDGSSEPERTARDRGDGRSDADVVRLVRDGRYCAVLADRDGGVEETLVAAAWLALERDMALVPGGAMGGAATQPDGRAGSQHTESAGGDEPTSVAAFYMDRYAVTNADFARFVAAGGYSEMELWPPEIWPNVLQFVDATGMSGPRDWSNGRPPRSREKHPVVGICWYEANAYAHWAGKRLPSSSEWERAGSWPAGRDGRGDKLRYPWGNAFDPAKANIWLGGAGTTVPVDAHDNGCTPNGIYQLVGNVWEWVAARYTCRPRGEGVKVVFESVMGEIRGGAFDTYFETQATCQFRTGQPLLYRGANVGFRCCVSGEGLRRPPDPSAFLE